MKKSRMFPFITKPDWNPLGGRCIHACKYCWARSLARNYRMTKYEGPPRLFEKEIRCHFKPDDYVFVCDMLDLFASNVPTEMILNILGVCKNHPETKFLLMTKNPERYNQMLLNIPDNCVCGTTIESNRFLDYHKYSDAPSPYERYDSMLKLGDLGFPELFVSVEPIMDFDLGVFVGWLSVIPHLKSVAVGMDNYNNNLPEPTLEKTLQLIQRLEACNLTVYQKTLRTVNDVFE